MMTAEETLKRLLDIRAIRGLNPDGHLDCDFTTGIDDRLQVALMTHLPEVTRLYRERASQPTRIGHQVDESGRRGFTDLFKAYRQTVRQTGGLELSESELYGRVETYVQTLASGDDLSQWVHHHCVPGALWTRLSDVHKACPVEVSPGELGKALQRLSFCRSRRSDGWHYQLKVAP